VLRVNNSSIQTKRSAKNVSCVFEKKGIFHDKNLELTRINLIKIKSTGAMTKPKRNRKQDDSDNTTSSQSSIELIMIKPDYTNLNEEEKKGITELNEEEKKYVIFLSVDLVFVRSSSSMFN
jgi:hypothetical protein